VHHSTRPATDVPEMGRDGGWDLPLRGGGNPSPEGEGGGGDFPPPEGGGVFANLYNRYINEK
jgi:hypothetical protein